METGCNDKEKAMERLKELLKLQKEIESEFGEKDYNVFVFGSYLTLQYQEGKSDIFYIDTTMEAPVYCAPLSSKIQFTDFFPEKLIDFQKKCQDKLEEARAKVVA